MSFTHGTHKIGDVFRTATPQVTAAPSGCPKIVRSRDSDSAHIVPTFGLDPEHGQDQGLRLLTTDGPNPDQADVVIGFAVRPADLAWLRSVYSAARAGRLAWVSYPKPGQPGTASPSPSPIRRRGGPGRVDQRHLVSTAAALGQGMTTRHFYG